MIARNLSRALCALLLFTLTASAQNIYPSRIGNYCLSDLATASASSQYSAGYPVASIIDGDRRGFRWGSGEGWADQTRDIYPDWARVDFGRSHSIGRAVIAFYQDAQPANRVEPYLGLRVGNNYTVEDFTVEVLNTQGVWVTVASATENLDVIREFTFTPVTGTAIRVVVTDAYANFSRIIELEAYPI